MGIREAMLALLIDGPKHGYQLKIDFEQATGEAWPLNIGQVYTTLQRMERDGLATSQDVDDEGRIVYQITDEGVRTLIDWTEQPVERSLSNRDEVSMKLLLSVAVPHIDPQHIIDIQRSATMAALQDFTRLRAQSSADDLAWQLHIDRLSIHAEADLRWLDRVEARLSDQSKPGSLPAPRTQLIKKAREGEEVTK